MYYKISKFPVFKFVKIKMGPKRARAAPPKPANFNYNQGLMDFFTKNKSKLQWETSIMGASSR